jgi:hypothetical protein
MTGFDSKREAAKDKQHWNEDEWRRNNWRCGHGWLRGEQCEICNAAQPAQEPVAWITPDGEGFRIRFSPPVNDVPLGWDALYTTPPQRQWIWLSDADIAEVVDTTCQYTGGYEEYLIKKAERKIRSMNNGT